MTPCKHWVTFEPGKVTPVVMTGDGRCPICRIEELERELAQLRAELEQAESRLREAQAQYDELIYAVAQKWPGETRHQTALRYIQNAERGDAARAAEGEEK